MNDDHVYMTLAEGHEDDTRWAYGTGFEDPLHGVDTTVPDGVDTDGLAALCLALGDDALVSAQRLAEWTTRAPELEEEMALANIGLDLLGQARLLYARCGRTDGTGRGEDAYAYFRDPGEFRNVTLAELPNGDFAFSMARLLVLSSWRLAHFEGLTASADPVLRAVAAKGVKELTYHRQYAAEWVVRLGDGTEESHRRMAAGLERVTPYLEELFAAHDAREEVLAVLRQVAGAGGIALPETAPAAGGPGREGRHTEHLAPLLTELQSVARAHPEATW
ncbi:1,2-phenylacetyl-CoA epoxidase subunit PaaC [Streptomyces sp. MJP52]|uniref:1,2-phenylacetyl-CoA epoxidase subunit PaaC n=1 Tax=Streptomyces sp. MJP52 TaxID=2940555 RepID=UPI00247657F6|nr:1,2-phenylacetyl-CoA epoxidase subunit PaaC [Streptomyces sp. MJP52]MDH6224492.1 ring-1,2-phenylacetyl-CoA epoxidase subunit PaaC [Streptomyces sp. MJP52]